MKSINIPIEKLAAIRDALKQAQSDHASELKHVSGKTASAVRPEAGVKAAAEKLADEMVNQKILSPEYRATAAAKLATIEGAHQYFREATNLYRQATATQEKKASAAPDAPVLGGPRRREKTAADTEASASPDRMKTANDKFEQDVLAAAAARS